MALIPAEIENPPLTGDEEESEENVVEDSSDDEDDTPKTKYEKSIARGTTSKSIEARAMIRKAVEQNPYFSCLDTDQIEKFVDNCTLVEYDKGDRILVEGDWGENFYILSGGVCDVVETIDGIEKQLDMRTSGQTFGVGGFLFNRKRSATVRARTKVFCWVMNRDRFWKHCLLSDKLQEEFTRYASTTNRRGKPRMTSGDFVRACFAGEVPDSESKVAQLLHMYKAMVGQHMAKIAFREYVLFHVLMARPDPEFDVAFALMDRQKKGYVDRRDLRRYVKNYWLPAESEFQFDDGCDLVARFFGKRGGPVVHRMRAHQLSVFLPELKLEVAQQAFRHMDRGNTGYVKGADLLRLLRDFSPHGLGRRLEERLRTLLVDEAGSKYYNFADYVGHLKLLERLPAHATAVKAAAAARGGPVSKDDFKVATKTLLGRSLSNVEADLIFALFDPGRHNRLGLADLQEVLGRRVGEELRPVRGRGDLWTFAPPPGYGGGDGRAVEDGVTEALDEAQDEARAYAHPGERYAQHEKAPATLLGAGTKALSSLALGGLAGAAGIAAVFPFDLVKTRLQTDGALTARYSGVADCALKVVRQDGFLGLYRGLLPTVLGMTPEKAVKLAVNDYLREKFGVKGQRDEINVPMEVLAGVGAGLSQTVFSTPIEVVKIRLQIAGEAAAAAAAAGRPPPAAAPSMLDLVRRLGVGGLYRAGPATILRDVPFSAIYFPCYALLKRHLAPEGQEPRASTIIAAGALAGVPAAFLTVPADVVKTRLQATSASGRGVAEVAAHILRHEGPEGFFKGALPRVLRQAPQFGVTLLAYELLHRAARTAIDPDLLPRPPTNAPVDEEDFMSAFQKGRMSKRVEDIQKLLRAENVPRAEEG